MEFWERVDRNLAGITFSAGCQGSMSGLISSISIIYTVEGVFIPSECKVRSNICPDATHQT